MEIRTFTALSSDGNHTLQGCIYCPDGYPTVRPKGIFHVVHGMCEYIGRYDTFMRELCADGWLVAGYDHLGHGHTAADAGELGYIARRRGWEHLAQDVGRFGRAVRTACETDGHADLPYVLMGHSMGSFVVRLAVARREISPDRLIIMGTGGPNPAAGAGLAVIGITKCLCGDKHISPLIDKLAFGSYNTRFSAENDSVSWLTTDRAVRDCYRADSLCTFKFTVSAMGDLIRLTAYTNRRSWTRTMSRLPAPPPILLVAGEEDPVGGYGRGVRTVHDRLLRAGLDATCRLYSGARHEILNDACREEVVRDIVEFVSGLADAR